MKPFKYEPKCQSYNSENVGSEISCSIVYVRPFVIAGYNEYSLRPFPRIY